MNNDPYLLITADTHAGGSHAAYREYLDPAYRSDFDEWRGGYKNPSQEHFGSKKLRNWDLELRRKDQNSHCLLYTSPSPRDRQKSRMPSSA